jgi:CheY-like chemotaxis protein
MSPETRSPAAPLVLVADDDPGLRALLAADVAAASRCRVVEAEDGAHAVQLALQLRPSAAALDLQMPRLDGAQAARAIRGLLPTLPLALHSGDPELLRERAADLGLPLFDKASLETLVHWLASQIAPAAAGRARRELVCAGCGYGIVARTAPAHCPLCHVRRGWVPAGRRRLAATP